VRQVRLDRADFCRASRSHIINLRWVAQVETAVEGGLVVALRNGPHVPVWRRQARRLREELSL
jgi:two-component system, LytTR family, response regulator